MRFMFASYLHRRRRLPGLAASANGQQLVQEAVSGVNMVRLMGLVPAVAAALFSGQTGARAPSPDPIIKWHFARSAALATPLFQALPTALPRNIRHDITQ